MNYEETTKVINIDEIILSGKFEEMILKYDGGSTGTPILILSAE